MTAIEADMTARQPSKQPSARFWDRIAEKYARQPIGDEAAYQKKLAITRGYMTPDMEIMEFGCGTGSTALLHAPHVRHILATDISPNMLDIARRKADEAAVDNVDFRVATLDDIEAPEGGFDMILGLSVLHLIEDPDAAIARVRALLKPGGVFVSSTACLRDNMWWLIPILPIGRALGFFPYVKIWRSADLVASLERNGFTIERNWLPKKNAAVFIVARATA